MFETFADDASPPGIGTPMVRIGDPVLKRFGVANVGWAYTGGARSGTIVDPRWSLYPNNEPFHFVLFTTSTGYPYGSCKISISGDTLTWQFPVVDSFSYTRPNTSFVYGIR